MAHRWLFDSHISESRSPWLQSALSELDGKTEAMLKLIEEDADTFARRAEMYYKKRPELVSMVEDFYRTHRSLVEKYDLLKSDVGTRRVTTLGSPFSSPVSQSEKLMSNINQICNRYFDSFSSQDSAESEVEDPEQEDVIQIGGENVENEDSSWLYDNEVNDLKEEMERLKELNKIQEDQLLQKDDEKREVIRQLSLAVEALKEENLALRKCIPRNSPKKPLSHFDLTKFAGLFLWKINASPNVVPL